MFTDGSSKNIGFLGLGTMGAVIAKRLILAGHKLTVYDVSLAAKNQFLIEDCRIAESAAEIGGSEDILIVMLPTSKHVMDALFSVDHIASNLQPGSLIIDMGTGAPAEMDEIATKLADLGIRYVDAPVCRGKQEAQDGTLLLLLGGDDEDVAQVATLLSSVANEVVHVGRTGAAIRLKLVNNYTSMVQMVLASEALAFAAKLGIARDIALSVLLRTPAGKGQISTNFPRKVLAGDLEADFPLRMGLKDLSLAMDLGKTSGMPLFLGAAAKELYALAEPWERSHQDCTAMLLLLEDIARIPHETPAGIPSG